MDASLTSRRSKAKEGQKGGGEVAESRDVEDALVEEYASLLSTLSDMRIKALVHATVSVASERKTFEAVTGDVSRETLVYIASGYLVRQKLKSAAVTSDPFPVWFRGEAPT